MTTEKISLSNIRPYKAVRMLWNSDAQSSDALDAYNEISHYLDEQSTKVCIVLDLRQNVHISLNQTVDDAMHSPYDHSNLGMWLIMGESEYARILGEVLGLLCHKNKVRCLADEAQVLSFLEANCPHKH